MDIWESGEVPRSASWVSLCQAGLGPCCVSVELCQITFKCSVQKVSPAVFVRPTAGSGGFYNRAAATALMCGNQAWRVLLRV